MNITLKTKTVAALAGVVLASAAAAAYAGYIPMPRVGAKSATPASSGKVSAVVNGESIYVSELQPVISQGVDPALAVDRYVNKVIAADMARQAYPQESSEAMRAADRDVLAQLFVAKRTADLRAGVTDAEVKAYYDANVKADDYASYQVKVLTTADQQEAEKIANDIAAGKAADYAQRFKLITDAADGFATANQFPYGLGAVVRSLKKGEFSKPLGLRNGFTILSLVDVKANPKPELAAVGEEIKTVIVSQKLTDQLVAARHSAKVELR